MKKSQTIVLILVGLAATVFLLWPFVTLKLAKMSAIKKYSSKESQVLNCIPSSKVLRFVPAATAPSYLIVNPPGCKVSLPSSEFQIASAKRGVFTNFMGLSVVCLGALDKTNFTSLVHETGRTNVFDFISSAYQATVTGISEQRNMIQLRQYLALLLYKATLAPVGFQYSWLQFDRGDLSGFISGDLAKDGKVVVEIYIKQKDEFLCVVFISRKEKTGEMSEVFHILSLLTVEADP